MLTKRLLCALILLFTFIIFENGVRELEGTTNSLKKYDEIPISELHNNDASGVPILLGQIESSLFCRRELR